MFILVPIFIITCCICSCMASSGAYLVNNSSDPKRNMTIDYFMYIGLCFGCCCILLMVIPPLFFGYSVLNFFGLA